MLADKYKELSPEKIELRKRIARLRHTATPYDKHLRLMYDEEGNQTDLRKEINRIISKVARGELSEKYLHAIKGEIKYALWKEKKTARENKYENGSAKTRQTKNKKANAHERKFFERYKEYFAEQEAAQELYEKRIHEQYKAIMLKFIGLNHRDMLKFVRKALPAPVKD